MVEKQPKNNSSPNKSNNFNTERDSQLRSLHGAFLEKNESKGKEALTADKFVEFVSQQSEGNSLLSRISRNSVKVLFDEIQNEGTAVHTIKQHTNYFRDNGIGEEEQLDVAYNTIKKNLESFPGKWDDFVKQHKLGFTSSPRGIAISEGAKGRTDIRSVGDLHAAWNSFIAKENINNDNMNRLLGGLSTARNEQVMIHAIFEKTRTKIDPSVRGSFDQAVGSIDAYSDIQTVDDLVRIIDQWVIQHPNQENVINAVVIRNSDIYKAYQRIGGQGRLQGDFSEWDKDLKTLIDRNSSLAATSVYEGSREYIQDNIKKAQGMMQVLSPTIASLSHQYPMDDTTLRAARGEYGKRIDHLNNEVSLRQKNTQESGDEGIKAKAALKKLHQEQQILRRKARVESIRRQDVRLAGLLAQGPSLDFDFSKLNKDDQCYLARSCARDQIENRDEQANLYGLDRERYSEFVRQMFDPEQQAIIIPTNEGQSLTIPVKDKGFLAGGVHPLQFQFHQLEDYKHLGFGVDVEVTNENEAGLKQMVPGLFQTINGQQIAPSYRVRLVDKNTGTTQEGYLMNVGYVGDDIAHADKNIANPTTQDQWMLFDFPPTKAGRKYPDPEIVRNGHNIGNTTEVEKIYDITPIDKTLTLTGDSLDQLALGWALGDRIQHDTRNQQSLDGSRDDMIDSARTPDPETFIDSYARQQQQTDTDINSVETVQDNFLSGFKQMVKAPDGYIEQHINTIQDLRGQTLWLQFGQSQIPPKDGSLPYWVQLEICDVDTADNTISFIMRGTDNKIQDNEGKKYTFPLESKTLRILEEGANDNTLYLLPKFSGDGSAMANHKNALVQAGVLDKESGSMFDSMELIDKGFKRHSDGKGITYFSEKKTIPDPKDPKKTIDLPITYRVKRTGKNNFQVTNPDTNYNESMNLSTLMIFLGERRLKALESSEKREFEDRIINAEKYKLKQKDGSTGRQTYVGGRYSLANVRSFGKDMLQKAKDGVENYNKKHTEDMTEILLGKYKLYDKLKSAFFFAPSIQDAFDNMHGDYMQERDKKTFDLINGYKEFLSQNPDGDEVTKDHVKHIMDNAANGEIPTKRRSVLFAAGAYLYMLEEHGDPYGIALKEYRGSGLWVRALCGEWHYKNYLSEAESVRAKLEADPTNANLLEAYADMEAKYIHQTIADNSSFKTFFSKKYSDAVIGAKWKGNDQERIDKTANVFGSQKDFELNEILFSVKIQNGDIGKTIGHLKAMAMTAQSSIQINKVRLYLLELMLSGMVLYQTKETTKETLQAIAAKIGFIPGTWVDNANQQHKIHTLLDYITGGNFSTQTNYNDNTFQRLNYGENIGDFHGKYKAWANSVEAQKVCDFLTLNDINEKGSRNLLTVIADGVGKPGPSNILTNAEHYDMLVDIKRGMMENSITRADRDLQNRYLFTAPLAIPNSVISGQLGPDRRTGQLDTGNTKETAMKEMFWRSLASKVPTDHVMGGEMFFIEKFESLIPGVTDSTIMQQSLLSAQYHLQERREPQVAREILTGVLGALPVSLGMTSLDRPVKMVLDNYIKFFLTNLAYIKKEDLMRSLNVSANMDIGSSRIEKPYITNFNWNQNINNYPVGTLNKALGSLRKQMENRGQPREGYFSSSASTLSDDTQATQGAKIVEMRPQLPPIQKTSNYAKEVPLYPNTSSSTLPHIEQYTADQLEAIARMKRVQEDDEDSGRYIDYGETG